MNMAASPSDAGSANSVARWTATAEALQSAPLEQLAEGTQRTFAEACEINGLAVSVVAVYTNHLRPPIFTMLTAAVARSQTK